MIFDFETNLNPETSEPKIFSDSALLATPPFGKPLIRETTHAVYKNETASIYKARSAVDA